MKTNNISINELELKLRNYYKNLMELYLKEQNILIRYDLKARIEECHNIYNLLFEKGE